MYDFKVSERRELVIIYQAEKRFIVENQSSTLFGSIEQGRDLRS